MPTLFELINPHQNDKHELKHKEDIRCYTRSSQRSFFCLQEMGVVILTIARLGNRTWYWNRLRKPEQELNFRNSQRFV